MKQRLEKNEDRVMNNLLKAKEDVNGEKRIKIIKNELEKSDEIQLKTKRKEIKRAKIEVWEDKIEQQGGRF